MDDLLKLKVNDLRKRCKDLGLSITGNKAELISRIQEHKNEGADDSVLNEAELLGELDGSDSQVVSNVDEDLLLGDSTSETKEDKNETTDSLNLDDHSSPVEAEAEPVTDEPCSKIPKLDVSPQKNIETVATTETSDEAKKLERAARFGINTSNLDEEKKLARAQRFGLDATKTNGDVSIDIEKLKNREKRFGVSVSDKLILAADEEKKQKRAERFGVQKAVDNEPVDVNSNDDKKSIRAARFGLNSDDEKKKARAARFGK